MKKGRISPKEKIFNDRLSVYMDEMKWLYMELYNDEKAFSYYVSMLRSYYMERREELLSLDQKRLESPGWYKGNDMLGMLMYVDCFAGTINGIRDHFD